MSYNLTIKTVIWLYNLVWGIAIPLLRINKRLAEGFEQRTLQHQMTTKADLWIQAASAGESYLAWSLLKNLSPELPIRVLVTSNTSQGLEILKRAIDDTTPNNRGIKVNLAYFPFDKPGIMKKAVKIICPKVMVLLESEIWPGLLIALKNYGCKTLIINGRLTSKSLKKYLIWSSFWNTLRPDKILAISENDAKRFGKLFCIDHVEVMQNIKFDRINQTEPETSSKNPLKQIFQPDTPFLVLGSIRREEESFVKRIIVDIYQKQPETVIGLFPRHMHRIKYWKEALERLSIPWELRSKTKKHVHYGTILLWDTFGELTFAYGLAKAAFVGGSLVPLGGQNFLEALTTGIIPVIGPYWENFAWVGREIIDHGLLREAADWREVSAILVENIKRPQSRKKVCKEALKYIKDRQGGTTRACHIINHFLRAAKQNN